MLIEEGIVRRKGSTLFFGAQKSVKKNHENFEKSKKVFVKIHLQLRLDRMLESEGVIGNEAGESYGLYQDLERLKVQSDTEKTC